MVHAAIDGFERQWPAKTVRESWTSRMRGVIANQIRLTDGLAKGERADRN